MASGKPNKTMAAKRASQLRKEHSHVRATKARPPRKEVQDLLRIPPNKHPDPVSNANVRPVANLSVDINKLVGDVVERLKAEVAIAEPLRELDPATNLKAPPPSPVEAAMLDVINVSEETEKLVHELAVRLAPVLREAKSDVGVLGAVAGGNNIPLVNALHERAGHITAINGQLLDLLDRLAT